MSNPEEALYLIRFRYSAQYTDETRAMRCAYNGKFENAYAVISKKIQTDDFQYKGILINQIFEITLCFAEKIALGRLKNTEETKALVWGSVKGVLTPLLRN